jgi:hypothetical protein
MLKMKVDPEKCMKTKEGRTRWPAQNGHFCKTSQCFPLAGKYQRCLTAQSMPKGFPQSMLLTIHIVSIIRLGSRESQTCETKPVIQMTRRCTQKKRESNFEGMSAEVIENKCRKNVCFPVCAEVDDRK